MSNYSKDSMGHKNRIHSEDNKWRKKHDKISKQGPIKTIIPVFHMLKEDTAKIEHGVVTECVTTN